MSLLRHDVNERSRSPLINSNEAERLLSRQRVSGPRQWQRFVLTSYMVVCGVAMEGYGVYSRTL